MTDEDELWNAWSSNSDAAIILDGRKLNDVFSSIRNQLDFLRRQQHGINEKLDIYSNNYNNTNTLGSINVSDLSVPKDTNINTKVTTPSTVMPEPVLDAEELQIILDRITTLESNVHKHDHINDRIDRLEVAINSKFSHFQNEIDKLSSRIESNTAMEARMEEKLNELDKQFNNKYHILSELYDEKLLILQQDNNKKFNEIEKINNNQREIIDINEIRIKKLENEQNKVLSSVHDMKETIDYFPIKYLDNIRNDIVELYLVKASKEDLNNKTDIKLTDLKTDLNEFNRLENYTNELTKRIELLNNELHQGFSTIDTKLEKRIDKVAHWCLKHLKKEIKNNNYDSYNDHHDGTDIGRVKCLVCDQVVNQQKETEIVHGGPPMKNVIKPHHVQSNQQSQSNQQYNNQYKPRPRSASPPGTRGKGFGTGATPVGNTNIATLLKPATTPPGTLPHMNTTTSTNNTTSNNNNHNKPSTHSKLVKLTAQPIHNPSNPAGSAVNLSHTNTTAATTDTTTNHNNHNNKNNEEQEHVDDFNYRIDTEIGAPPHLYTTAATLESPIRLAHPAPLHTKTTTTTGTTTATSGGGGETSTHPSERHHMGVSQSQPILPQQLHQFHVGQQPEEHYRDMDE